MGKRRVDWSALPIELLRSIAEANPDRNDVVRFRSVCASWRSSIPPCEILPSYRLPRPYPTRSGRGAYVSHRTFYRLKLTDDVNPNPSTCSSKSWLVKVGEFGFGRQCLLNPLTNLCFGLRKEINLLDYQVVEVSKEYELQSIRGMRVDGVNKLVLFPDSAWNGTCVEDTLIFALYQDGRLGYVKDGDKTWTPLLDDPVFNYDDITVYKGKPCVVGPFGTVSWIDSSMKLIQISPPLCGMGDQMHLVVSCGELYVVDRFFSKKRRFDHDLRGYRDCPKTITFKVYKLDQDRWVKVKNLGDQVFVLGKDRSFSVSATKFSGCKGNCIYFTYEDDNGVFDQNTGEIVDFQDSSHLFRLPPSWLNSNPHLNGEFK